MIRKIQFDNQFATCTLDYIDIKLGSHVLIQSRAVNRGLWYRVIPRHLDQLTDEYLHHYHEHNGINIINNIETNYGRVMRHEYIDSRQTNDIHTLSYYYVRTHTLYHMFGHTHFITCSDEWIYWHDPCHE